MHTFIFIADVSDHSLARVLNLSIQIVKRSIPSLNAKLLQGCTILPKCSSGWIWLSPDTNNDCPIISEFVEDRYAVIVFGEVVDGEGSSAAEKILTAWKLGGSHAVRSQEGCFSAVIIDQIGSKVTLISDLVGQRMLRYYTSGRTLIASPHDIPIVATGQCPVSFDYVSACSVAAVGWSLRGKSLLKEIQTCHPSEYIQWCDGKIHHFKSPILNLEQRIARKDTKAIVNNLDRMIETSLDNLKSRIANKSEITITLSAGIDSRVVLSLLLSAVHPSQITAITVGEPDSLDVRVAKQLAQMYDFQCVNSLGSSKIFNPNDFIAHCDLLAFVTNGDVTVKDLTLKTLPNLNSNSISYIHGDGGEIFRGYLYHNIAHRSSFPPLSPIDALKIVHNRIRIDSLWKSQELVTVVFGRLKSIIDEYTDISSNGYDILDLFYLYERTAIWGARKQRETWQLDIWPFYSRKMIELAYLMPAPISNYACIHRESLRRFLPKAYWMRVNGKMLPPLEGEKFSLSLLRRVDRNYLKILRRTQSFWSRSRPKSDSNGIEQLRARTLSSLLKNSVFDLLLSEGTLTQELFDRSVIESFLRFDQLPALVCTDLIGSLIAMERWRCMVQEVAREASHTIERIYSSE